MPCKFATWIRAWSSTKFPDFRATTSASKRSSAPSMDVLPLLASSIILQNRRLPVWRLSASYHEEKLSLFFICERTVMLQTNESDPADLLSATVREPGGKQPMRGVALRDLL